MVADAEAAGFNPLTALRMGGGAGYTQTSSDSITDTVGLTDTNVSSKTIGTAMVAGTPIIGPALSNAGSIIGNAIDSYNPMANAMREAEYDLAQAQIANLNADTAARGRTSIGGVPTWSAGPIARNPGTGMLSSGVTLNSNGMSITPTVETPTATNPFPASWGWSIDPSYPDAEVWETRFAEAGGLIGGLINLDEALTRNLGNPTTWGQALRRGVIDEYNSALDLARGIPPRGAARWGY